MVFMKQDWWVGPVAKAGTGDIGVFMGFLIAVVLICGARWAEKRRFNS